MRVEVPILQKEFTFGAWIGTDPEGAIYYNDTADFDKATQFKVFQVNNPDDGSTNNPCVRVEFWYRGESVDDPYAIFFAEDPTRTVTQTGFDKFDSGSSTSPAWRGLNIAQVSALVHKDSVSNNIKVTVDILGKTCNFTVDKDYFDFGTQIDSHGTFSFKSIPDLNSTKAKTVNYGPDRIVWYDGPNAQDFIAYFMPGIGIRSIKGGNNALGDVKYKEFSGATWS